MPDTIRYRTLGHSLALICKVLLLLSVCTSFPASSQNSDNKEGLFEEYFSKQIEKHQQFGLHRRSIQLSNEESRQVVILIHGLDDPGKVWMNLEPVLVAQGYDVWVFEYPDDQAIHKSADLLNREMKQHRLQLGDQVEIIAHSMGGLVSREMLTHPDFQSGSVIQRPAVHQLIMVGTPNHGSHLARFRLFSEIRDQLFSESFHWLGGLIDGDGQAGKDLIPDSHFLQQLNARKRPYNTEYIVIAGVLSSEELKDLSLHLKPHINLNERVQALYRDLMDSIGDGVVPIESAKLADARFYQITGTHLSIIRNIFKSSQRVPPAIPLIINILDEEIIIQARQGKAIQTRIRGSGL